MSTFAREKDHRSGFTLLELVVFAGMFTVVAIAFVSILITMTRVQLNQEGAAEVNSQSQFLLQTVQRYVEQSVQVDMTTDLASTTMKLRMASTTYDPTYIYLSAGTLYVKETDSGTAQPLTSSKVKLSNVSFTKRENANGHDSVSVAYTMSYSNPNLLSRFSQSLRTSVARVSAATFDSDIRSSGTSYVIGSSNGEWRSINGTIYFNTSNANVGIGATNPAAKLQVAGDVYIDSNSYGLIEKSPNGNCWRLRVADTGAVTSTAITCP